MNSSERLPSVETAGSFTKIVPVTDFFPEMADVGPAPESVPEFVQTGEYAVGQKGYTEGFVNLFDWDEECLESLKGLQGCIFLDIGAGRNLYGAWLAKMLGMDYCGVEFNAESAKILQEKIRTFNEEQWRNIATGDDMALYNQDHLKDFELPRTMKAAVWSGDMMDFVRTLEGQRKMIVNLCGIGSGFFHASDRAPELARALSEVLADGAVLIVHASDFAPGARSFYTPIPDAEPFAAGGFGDADTWQVIRRE